MRTAEIKRKTAETDIKLNLNLDVCEKGVIKTGCGFLDHMLELFAKHVTNGKKIKAAGGIASLKDAEEFIKLGAERLGTSRIVKIAKAEGNISGY